MFVSAQGGQLCWTSTSSFISTVIGKCSLAVNLATLRDSLALKRKLVATYSAHNCCWILRGSARSPFLFKIPYYIEESTRQTCKNRDNKGGSNEIP